MTIGKRASDIAKVKWRNQVLALICLAIFAALGVLYFQNWVVQKPFAVILFVGEGLTAQRLAAARVYNGGADSWLAIDGLEFTARVRNYSADFAVPDSGAAASAIATGSKVKNGTLSMSEAGSPLRTILELAHEKGRATGVVTDGALTNPAMAAFYAHSNTTKQARELANLLVDGSEVDIALGGGGADFRERTDPATVRVVHNLAELEAISDWQRPRVLGVFADGNLPFTDDLPGRSELPSLGDMVRRSIEMLQVNRRGYFLVVNAHLMGSAALQNRGERTLRETAELDRAVQVAREYAGAKAAIVVIGDVDIGGMNVSGYPFRHDSGVAVLGLNSAGQPWITWASGPNGGRMPAATADRDSNRDLLLTEPALVQVPSALNSLEDPVASATGIGMEKFHGTIENTAIFSILRDVF